jgi:hypothetical protein
MSEGDNTAVVDDGGEEIVITDRDLYQHAISDEPPLEPKPAEPPRKRRASRSRPRRRRAMKKVGLRRKKTPAQPEPPKPAEAAPQPQPKPHRRRSRSQRRRIIASRCGNCSRSATGAKSWKRKSRN